MFFSVNFCGAQDIDHVVQYHKIYASCIILRKVGWPMPFGVSKFLYRNDVPQAEDLSNNHNMDNCQYDGGRIIHRSSFRLRDWTWVSLNKIDGMVQKSWGFPHDPESGPPTNPYVEMQPSQLSSDYSGKTLIGLRNRLFSLCHEYLGILKKGTGSHSKAWTNGGSISLSLATHLCEWVPYHTCREWLCRRLLSLHLSNQLLNSNHILVCWDWCYIHIRSWIRSCWRLLMWSNLAVWYVLSRSFHFRMYPQFVGFLWFAIFSATFRPRLCQWTRQLRAK